MQPPRLIEMLPITAFLPDAHDLRNDQGARLLNPSINRLGDGFVVVYRIISSAGDRQIHACRLDASLKPIAGSAVELSALLPAMMPHESAQSRSWFADPRTFWLAGGLYISWNDGFHYVDGRLSPHNNQYLVELDRERLHPAGPVRRMRRIDGQFRPEKNWMLFCDGSEWRCVYSIAPHKILVLADSNETELVWQEKYVTPNLSPYPQRFGEMRGGAQPVRRGEHFFHFAHSAWPAGDKRTYGAALYSFEARAPYRVCNSWDAPLPLPRPPAVPALKSLNENAGEILYVTGVVDASGQWILSYGVDDKMGCIAIVDDDWIATLPALPNRPSRHESAWVAVRALARRTLNRLRTA